MTTGIASFSGRHGAGQGNQLGFGTGVEIPPIIARVLYVGMPSVEQLCDPA